jgi:hypothetical protein
LETLSPSNQAQVMCLKWYEKSSSIYIPTKFSPFSKVINTSWLGSSLHKQGQGNRLVMIMWHSGKITGPGIKETWRSEITVLLLKSYILTWGSHPNFLSFNFLICKKNILMFTFSFLLSKVGIRIKRDNIYKASCLSLGT